MARVTTLRALHYDLARTGGLDPVLAPPYDVIDAQQRSVLAARSPFNVVEIDLPEPGEDGGDRYEHAAQLLTSWQNAGVLRRDPEPALWVLQQDYTGPDGRARTRTGFLARVRVEAYGAGRIRPHERTHPGPREDRLRLTRATRTNISPIFSLFSDAQGAAREALEKTTAQPHWGDATDSDGTGSRLWRIADPAITEALLDAAGRSELLIADGHHRYETARVYADEVGGEGPHRYTLMCLVALEDEGLTVFPTHRLVRGLTPERWRALDEVVDRNFTSTDANVGVVPATNSGVQLGYLDTRTRRPRLLTLKDRQAAAEALPSRSEAYRHLDTAVLEALILKGAFGLTDEQIDHLDGLAYARDTAQAEQLVASGEVDAAFFMAPTPIARVQEIAAAGEIMPPKSTYFFPKVPTGLVFSPLHD